MVASISLSCCTESRTFIGKQNKPIEGTSSAVKVQVNMSGHASSLGDCSTIAKVPNEFYLLFMKAHYERQDITQFPIVLHSTVSF